MCGVEVWLTLTSSIIFERVPVFHCYGQVVFLELRVCYVEVSHTGNAIGRCPYTYKRRQYKNRDARAAAIPIYRATTRFIAITK